MTGLELLKTAINEGVKVLPVHFLRDNNIKAKCLGQKHYSDINEDVYVFVIEEEGELKDKVVYQHRMI